MYVKDNLVVDNIERFTNGYCEVLCISIKALSTNFVTFYRPPPPFTEYAKFVEAIEFAEKFIQEQPEDDNNVILGDFNLKKEFIRWMDGGEDGAIGFILNPDSTQDCGKTAVKLLDFMHDHGLSQHILEITRIIGQNILDLCITNDTDMIQNIEVKDTELSDHQAITINTSIPLKRFKEKDEAVVPEMGTYNFSKANHANIKSELRRYNLIEIWNTRTSFEDGLNKVYNVIIECCKSSNVPKKNNRKSFIPRARVRLFRYRTYTRKKLLRAKAVKRKEELLEKIAKIDSEIKQSIEDDYKRDEIQAVEQIKENPKAFYKFAQARKKTKCGIGPLRKKDGTLTTNNQEVADELSSEYKAAFSTPDPEAVVHDPKTFFLGETLEPSEEETKFEPLTDLEFTPEDVKNAFKSFKKGSSPGPDCFPTDILKECAEELAPVFYLIYRESIDEGNVPEFLKMAKITPLPKGGSRQFAKNFRPVALTSNIVKGLEKIIKKAIVDHLKKWKIISKKQHGFVGQHSTLSQLLEHVEDILERLEDYNAVLVVYLDFKRAFDKVDIGILLRACKKIGITGKIGYWLSQFLTGRKQFVCANKTNSKVEDVPSSVPQGSILGAILFIILLNTIYDQAENGSTVGSFADDTKVTNSAKEKKDEDKINFDLQAIYKWAAKMNMEFNSGKFQLIKYGFNEELKAELEVLDPEGNPITESREAKDLGVWMTNDLQPDYHIQKTVQAASNTSGYILRTFKSRDAEVMKPLMKQLIIPKLDYCSPLINPHTVALKMKMEQPIRAFTRKMNGMTGLNYHERLSKLKMLSMERRRERFIVINVFKILHGLAPNPGIEFTNFDERRGVEAVIPKINKNHKAKLRNLKENFFTMEGAKLFNALPKEVRAYNPDVQHKVHSFKNLLDKYLELIPDQPHVPDLQRTRAACSNSIVDQIPYRERSSLPWNF